ncbi:hypothetical protein SPIRO4BDMA_40232 [uncultured spirochete]|uniref:Uncharacterized protein n=1 Tax=uncultured spirochete TaxID=156406 RepID=A0A3P3XP35_9SPIR|nr:hypothetical protein SPIRO4BDMA_40232 [uncultured spirochete]
MLCAGGTTRLIGEERARQDIPKGLSRETFWMKDWKYSHPTGISRLHVAQTASGCFGVRTRSSH